MFSSKIKQECTPVIAATVVMSPESQKGFELLSIIAAALVDYMITHYSEFQHFRRNASYLTKASVYEENVNTLRSKLQTGEIQPSKPEGISDECFERMISQCPYPVMKTASYISEEYNLQRNAYWGSKMTLPKPEQPKENVCKKFKIKDVRKVLRNEKITFPFVEDDHLFARKINLTAVNSTNYTNINVEEAYVEQYNGTVRIVIYPVMFVDKRFFYNLHDIKVMGVDLGANTDATCAIYANSTSECKLKQIQIPLKHKIWQLQRQYQKTNNKETKESLRREIHALNEAYRKELAESICQYAVENKVEFVFLEGLQKNTPKDEAEIFWNPKSTLEVIYSELHGAGIAYRSVSAANTSQYYHKGGYVERDKNNYSNIKNMEVITMNKYDIQRARDCRKRDDRALL